MVEKVATFRKIPVSKQECRHHWIIDCASARTSPGICELCGARKDFSNDLKDCLRQDKEQYLEWLRSSGKEAKPEKDIISQIEDLFRTFAS